MFCEVEEARRDPPLICTQNALTLVKAPVLHDFCSISKDFNPSSRQKEQKPPKKNNSTTTDAPERSNPFWLLSVCWGFDSPVEV